MAIDKLTSKERRYLEGFRTPESNKALSIIDAQAAEIERLRAEKHDALQALDLISCYKDAESIRANAAESRLADATALLSWLERDVLFIASEARRKVCAFLAAAPAQPAAPAHVIGCNARQGDGRCNRACQPAAPARTEECLSCNRELLVPARTEAEQHLPQCDVCGAARGLTESQHTHPNTATIHDTLQGARDLLRQLNPRVVTEAEQAVLDAMGEIDEHDLREAALEENGYAQGAKIARAELARREAAK